MVGWRVIVLQSQPIIGKSECLDAGRQFSRGSVVRTVSRLKVDGSILPHGWTRYAPQPRLRRRRFSHFPVLKIDGIQRIANAAAALAGDGVDYVSDHVQSIRLTVGPGED